VSADHVPADGQMTVRRSLARLVRSGWGLAHSRGIRPHFRRRALRVQVPRRDRVAAGGRGRPGRRAPARRGGGGDPGRSKRSARHSGRSAVMSCAADSLPRWGCAASARSSIRAPCSIEASSRLISNQCRTTTADCENARICCRFRGVLTSGREAGPSDRHDKYREPPLPEQTDPTAAGALRVPHRPSQARRPRRRPAPRGLVRHSICHSL
jgi:hypothetical protein